METNTVWLHGHSQRGISFGQGLERFREAHLVEFHHEVDGASGLPAGKAVVEGAFLVRDDAEGGSTVLVEGTEADMLPALGAELQVFTDERDEVRRSDHSVSIIVPKSWSQRIVPGSIRCPGGDIKSLRIE